MRPWLVLVPFAAACAAGGHHHGSGGDDDGGTVCCDGGGGDGGGGDDDGGPAPDAPPHVDCTDGLGPWTGHDVVDASQSPPCGLSAAQVPQFLGIGFDDNAYSGLDGSAGTGGVSWATSMLAARGIHATFYLSTIYMDVWESESPTFVKRAWHTAMTDGNEIGDHTRDHAHGAAFDAATWHTQQQDCIDSLTKPFDPAEVNFSPDPTKGIGASASDIVGFRTPFLEYDDATFTAEQQVGIHYDCSIEDGYEEDEDGSNYMWPYTLDHGSPGNDVLVDWGSQQPLTPHPGLWELPVHPFVVPPDDKCAQYGVEPGLRDRLHALQDWFDPASGKITGFDYNLWVQFAMTKAEFVATLEYTLDLRLGGNRAPMMIGAHSDIYSSKYTAATASTAEERQQAMEEFIDYALSKPMVRVVPNQEILEWVRNPQPL